MKKTFALFLPVLFTGFMLMGTKSKNVLDSKRQIDGPYVFYKNDKVHINYIFDENGKFTVKSETKTESDKGDIKLRVSTDQENSSFEVQLKKSLKNEKTEYSGVKKMFVVSDIEGEFKAFRELLQGNGVIDDKFNWTFRDGHLVLTGDFVDRGTLVTEVLWLIYSLEEKAKEAGGYVHFILGNHEIMNMNNDLRYVHPKYMLAAEAMNENYLYFYSENTELGRWLHTKNISEKIGDILFMHAGISAEMNYLELSLNRMNKLARPYYSDTTMNYKNLEVEIIYSDFGPFWYRGYYYGTPRAKVSQIDSTLSYYRVKHIATGHTVISDTINVQFNGKLINTDVHHSKGHSEGLLIEDKNFYRTNASGVKHRIL